MVKQINKPKNIKPIPGFSSYYAGENGSIYRISKTKGWIELSTQLNKSGYLVCQPFNNKKRYVKYVHRLILSAFKGIQENMQCHHIDHNTTNNHINNLMWVTPSKNVFFSYQNGNRKPKGKIILQYDLEGNFIKEWLNASNIEKTLNIPKSKIGLCCRGNLKSFGGFVWKYKENLL